MIIDAGIVGRLFEIVMWEARRRVVLMKVIGALLAGLLVFRCLPYLATLFEGFYLYLTWPLLALVGAGYYAFAGFQNHRRTGLSTYFPFFSIAVAILFVAIVEFLLTEWAVDWSPIWAALMLVVFAAASFVIAVGLIAYTEIWRSAAVVGEIRERLVVEPFEQHQIELPGEKNRLIRQITTDVWGSPHCLKIIEGYYEETKLSLLKNANTRLEQADLKAYYKAGECLWSYLALKWPDKVFDLEMLEWKRSELARETITSLLIFGSFEGAKTSVLKLTDVWIEQLNRAIASHTAYKNLLLLILNLGRAGRPVKGADETRVIIENVTKLYRAIQSSSHEPAKFEMDYQELCSNTWLALAPRHLSSQACFDVWMMMKEGRGDLTIEPSEKMDPARIAAELSLTRLYEHWSRRTNPDWDELLVGRTVYAKGLVETTSRNLSKASQQ